MKLNDFLARGGRSAPTKPVKFKILGQDTQSGERILVDADALLSIVSESDRADAIADARKAADKKFEGGIIPDAWLSNEQTYRLLLRALRDSEDTRAAFCNSIDLFKSAVSLPVITELYSKYKEFEADEYPADVSPEEFAALVEDAKKKSLLDLLSSTDYKLIRSALPTLAALSGTSPTQT